MAGKIEAGSESDLVTGFEDWLPTLLDLSGSKTPVPDGVDGISIADTLLGKKQDQRDFLYREFAAYEGQQAVWIGKKWKAIRQNLLPRKNKKGNPNLKIELYDLENDIAESKDVAAENPEIVKEAEAILKREHVPSKTFKFPPLDALKN